MFVALFVALLAVALGLLLGLAPGAGQRAFGPLRTLALTAVLAVVGLHLLPEALGELRAVGLLVFAAAVALPRWIAWLPKRALPEKRVGLELGFWALVIHHVGDGLALGAYGRVDDSGNRHIDVLLALVLHTVPLVAVVAAGYAQAVGRRAAVLRSGALALASALGVLLTGFVPESIAAGAQAWVAAGVSGLLLHGLTHDLGHDLPESAPARALDFAMALVGGLMGYLGMRLESHADPRSLPVWLYLSAGLERVAFPFALGLLLSSLPALWERPDVGPEESRVRLGTALGGEGFLVTLASFGWFFAVARDVLGAIGVALQQRATPPANDQVNAPPASRWRAFAERAQGRFDALAAWCFAGVVVSAIIQAALPWGALALTPAAALGVGLVFALSVPLHAVAASQLAGALFVRGFPGGASFLIAALAPLGGRRPGGAVLSTAVLALVAGLLFGADLPRAPLWIAPWLAQGAALLLLFAVLIRSYQVGLRRLLLALKQ